MNTLVYFNEKTVDYADIDEDNTESDEWDIDKYSDERNIEDELFEEDEDEDQIEINEEKKNTKKLELDPLRFKFFIKPINEDVVAARPNDLNRWSIYSIIRLELKQLRCSHLLIFLIVLKLNLFDYKIEKKLLL